MVHEKGTFYTTEICSWPPTWRSTMFCSMFIILSVRQRYVLRSFKRLVSGKSCYCTHMQATTALLCLCQFSKSFNAANLWCLRCRCSTTTSVGRSTVEERSSFGAVAFGARLLLGRQKRRKSRSEWEAKAHAHLDGRCHLETVRHAQHLSFSTCATVAGGQHGLSEPCPQLNESKYKTNPSPGHENHSPSRR